MKKEIISFTDGDGEALTLYSVKIREEGTRKVSDGILIHKDNDIDNEYDRLSGGAVGLNEPTTAEEAEALLQIAVFTQNFRIDGNGYYIFIE